MLKARILASLSVNNIDITFLEGVAFEKHVAHDVTALPTFSRRQHFYFYFHNPSENFAYANGCAFAKKNVNFDHV